MIVGISSILKSCCVSNWDKEREATEGESVHCLWYQRIIHFAKNVRKILEKPGEANIFSIYREIKNDTYLFWKILTETTEVKWQKCKQTIYSPIDPFQSHWSRRSLRKTSFASKHESPPPLQFPYLFIRLWLCFSEYLQHFVPWVLSVNSEADRMVICLEIPTSFYLSFTTFPIWSLLKPGWCAINSKIGCILLLTQSAPHWH